MTGLVEGRSTSITSNPLYDHRWAVMQWDMEEIIMSAYKVIVLDASPERKITAIKRLREITGFGLADAKSILDNAPSTVMDGMFQRQANELKQLLEDAGIEVEIQPDEHQEPLPKSLQSMTFERNAGEAPKLHRFVHEFEDDPRLGDFDVDLDPPPEARIQFDLDGKDIWLSANRAGWLHLACICAEMGLHSEFQPGYHFHRSYDWGYSPKQGQEVSFELAGDEEPI